MTTASDEPIRGSDPSSPQAAETALPNTPTESPTAEAPTAEAAAPRPGVKIRIGSQRSAVEIERVGLSKPATPSAPVQPAAAPPAPAASAAVPAPTPEAAPVIAAAQADAAVVGSPAATTSTDEVAPAHENRARRRERKIEAPPTNRHVEVPNIRAELPAEWEQEVEAALGGMSVDDLLDKSSAQQAKTELAPETLLKGRVVSMHRDNIFVDLGQRYQGVLSLRQLSAAPEVGALLDVQIIRFDPEEGLYQVTAPGAAVDVGNWGDVNEGMVVQARVTGHNKGGLECEVNSLRGFIPASQVSMYRIEDLSTCVGESWACVVTEVNPEKRNLVLSRRSVLERESAAAREQMMAELQPGAVREGTVRRVQDFGAFVDIGGVDGLVHVSQLAWNRIKHPSEVVSVGDKVTVRVQKIDPETGKISLSMKELADNPWNTVASRYTAKSTHDGKVSKVMEFGAFVELEPGVEGLIHISELDHKRVFRVQDVLKEGDLVAVQVISVDVPTRRISLSRKALLARAETVKPAAVEEAEPAPYVPKTSAASLKGGRTKSSDGERFGLKW